MRALAASAMLHVVGRLSALARVLHVSILGVWAGAGAYHLLVVLPSALAAFPSKHDALAFVGAGAAQLDRFGMIAGPLVLITLLGWVGQGRSLGLRALGAVLLMVGTIVSRHWLGPQIVGLEGELLQGAPVSEALNRLYTASDGVLIGTVAIALLMLLAAPPGAGERNGGRIQLGGRL